MADPTPDLAELVDLAIRLLHADPDSTIRPQDRRELLLSGIQGAERREAALAKEIDRLKAELRTVRHRHTRDHREKEWIANMLSHTEVPNA